MNKKVIAILIIAVGVIVSIILLTRETKVEKYESCVQTRSNSYYKQMELSDPICDINSGVFNSNSCMYKLELEKAKIKEIKDECSRMYLN